MQQFEKSICLCDIQLEEALVFTQKVELLHNLKKKNTKQNSALFPSYFRGKYINGEKKKAVSVPHVSVAVHGGRLRV